ncbi:MAG: GNAT family N-acetyltransferase [Armatimonadota bacterium]
MEGAVRWATADDIPSLAELLALAFPREFGRAFGTSHQRRAAGLGGLLGQGFLRWRDALVLDQREGVLGAAFLCWEDSQRPAPLLRCAPPVAQASGWLRLPWALFVLSFLLEERPRPGGCEVGMLAVRPDKRRRGIGRMLLEEVQRQALGRKCDHLSLSVAANNRPARGLYAKLGFETVAVRLDPIRHLLFGAGRGLRMRKQLST